MGGGGGAQMTGGLGGGEAQGTGGGGGVQATGGGVGAQGTGGGAPRFQALKPETLEKVGEMFSLDVPRSFIAVFDL